MKTEKQYRIKIERLQAKHLLEKWRQNGNRFNHTIKRAGGLAAFAVLAASIPASGGALQVLKRPTTEPVTVRSAAFSPDGKQLAIGSSASANKKAGLSEGTIGVIEFYDLTSGRWLRTLRQNTGTEGGDQSQRVESVIFSPDGRSLLATDRQGYVLWDVASGKEKRRWGGMFFGPDISPGWSPDGKRVAMPWLTYDPSRNGMAIINLETGDEEAFVPVELGYIRTARFSPDGRLVATAGSDRGVQVFDVSTKMEIFIESTGTPVFAACFSPDGRELVAGSSWAGVLLLYDISEKDGKVSVKKKADSSPTYSEVHRVEYHPDGKRAVALAYPEQMRIWNTGAWQKSVQKKGMHGWLSIDGKQIAVVKTDAPTTVEVWRTDDFFK